MRRRDFLKALVGALAAGLAPLSAEAQQPRGFFRRQRRPHDDPSRFAPFMRTPTPHRPSTGQDRARQALREGRIRPLGDILGSVRRRFPGKVLDVDLLEHERGYIYRVKMLGRDGNVRVIAVDAASGRILAVRGRRR